MSSRRGVLGPDTSRRGENVAERAAQPDLITLPHHVEFLSERWLQEAERFWREALPARKAKLGGRPFAVSERFTNAPPHLNLIAPGDVASWSLRFDGEVATVARG